LITPEASRKIDEPTSASRLSRSSACATERVAGRSNSRGMTDQSFASSSGISAKPAITCSDWVSE
jgi:hypothetical protein